MQSSEATRRAQGIASGDHPCNDTVFNGHDLAQLILHTMHAAKHWDRVYVETPDLFDHWRLHKPTWDAIDKLADRKGCMYKVTTLTDADGKVWFRVGRSKAS